MHDPVNDDDDDGDDDDDDDDDYYYYYYFYTDVYAQGSRVLRLMHYVFSILVKDDKVYCDKLEAGDTCGRWTGCGVGGDWH